MTLMGLVIVALIVLVLSALITPHLLWLMLGVAVCYWLISGRKDGQ